MSGRTLEKTHRCVKGGRPVDVSWRDRGWPTPTSAGSVVCEVMWGTGSSTTTFWVIVVQPAALQALRVTCLVPADAKLVVGFCDVEVNCAWAPAASGRSARDMTKALRKAGEG